MLELRSLWGTSAAIAGTLILGGAMAKAPIADHPPAAAAAGTPSAPLEGSEPDAGADASRRGSYTEPLDRPVDEIRTFFGFPRKAQPGRPGEKSELAQALEHCQRCPSPAKPLQGVAGLGQEIQAMAEARGYRLRFLVVLVPDPVGSYVGSQFDTYATALLRGASASHWLPDRHWLPWRDKEPAVADAKEPRTQSVFRPWSSPGIVLFRKAPGDSRGSPDRALLAIFLVGESPLTGIRKQAFVDSLRLVSSIQPAEEIRVLGPFSSGAADSCSLALAEWYGATAVPPSNPVSFLSGSATSPSVGERLKPQCRGCDSLKVTFRRTVASDSAMQEAGFQFFEEHLGWAPDEIALLVESDSSYGQMIAWDARRHWRLVLKVPSALSGVRTASERSRKAAEEVEIAGVRVPPQGLELRLDETRAAQDTFPVFDPMTAPSDELELESLLSTLARERIRHLGLVFTDIRDRLFVAEKVKLAAPHLSLFTFESSALYVHPRVNPYTDGMLVVSSYPLSMSAQQLMAPWKWSPGAMVHSGSDPEPDRWKGVWGERVQFGSDPEQGLYNATVVALAEPGQAPEVADYLTIPGTRYSAPGVWISAVGDGRLVPLAAVRPFDSSALPLLLGTTGRARGSTGSAGAVPPELRRLIRRLGPTAGLRFFLWLASLVFALLGASLALAYSKTETRTRLALASAFRPLTRPDDVARRQQKRWIAALVVTTAASWMALVTVYLVPFVLRARLMGERREIPANIHGEWLILFEEFILRLLTWVLPFAGILLVILLAGLGWMLGRGGPTRSRVLYACVLGATMAAAIVLSQRALSVFRPEAGSLDRAAFTFLRAAGGPGNLSPLAGILLLAAGFALFIVFQLQRLRIRDDWRCQMPTKALERSQDLPLRSLEKPQELLDQRIRQGLPRSVTFWAPFLVLLGPLLVVFFFRFEAASDSYLWSKTFAFLFAFLVLPASLAAFYRFASMWRALRRIIVRQEWSRLGPAFQSCQEELEWRSLRVWGPSRKHNYSTLIGSAELLRRLVLRPERPRVTEEVSLAPGREPVTLRHLAHEVETSLTAALAANARGEVESERAARVRALAALDDASQHVQLMLNHVDVPGAFSEEPEIRKELTGYVALRAIAYIRYVFAEIRNSLLAFTVGILFLLFGLASFHFQPIRSVYVVLWSVIGVIAFATVAIFIQMDKDTVLSRIGGTTPGEVNPIKSGLLLRIAAFVLPPVAALIVTQFPRLGQPLSSWLNPLLRLFQ